MSAPERGALRPIRLVFELSREENPRLFDELSQFRQGRKRVWQQIQAHPPRPSQRMMRILILRSS